MQKIILCIAVLGIVLGFQANIGLAQELASQNAASPSNDPYLMAAFNYSLNKTFTFFPHIERYKFRGVDSIRKVPMTENYSLYLLSYSYNMPNSTSIFNGAIGINTNYTCLAFGLGENRYVPAKSEFAPTTPSDPDALNAMNFIFSQQKIANWFEDPVLYKKIEDMQKATLKDVGIHYFWVTSIFEYNVLKYRVKTLVANDVQSTFEYSYISVLIEPFK